MEYNNPFEHSHFIGYVNQVNPTNVNVHFPSSTLLQSFFYKGENFNGGHVGNFVVIEGEKDGFLAKILELNLPEKERLELSEKSFKNNDFHPIGKVEILMSFDIFNPHNIEKGLNTLPVIGAKVFVCSSDFIKSYFKNFGVKEENIGKSPVFPLGKLTHDYSCTVEVSQQALFGRHCAVVGTTGGGKSYSVSRLLEGVISNKGKSIIIDATGEYAPIDEKHHSEEPLILSNGAYFPYSKLSLSDLFVLFRPSGQVQQPILLEAIKSLKIAQCLIRDKSEYDNEETNDTITFTIGAKKLIIKGGCIVKQGNNTAPFKNSYFKYVNEIEDSSKSDFDISKLSTQIMNECYNDFGDKWSDRRDERNFGNSTSLIMRINNIINDDSYKKLFGFHEENGKNLIDSFTNFLSKENEKYFLRVGFENVPFNFQAREILANAIGKYLLNESRKKKFIESPLILFLDEAHQFLNKSVKDEYFEQTELNSFESIAKESRKHGLFLCISTQMPRDIPVGTLSQIGTFIVHRLINHFDKEAIANASSSANRSTLDFLPILGAGEAILMGVDFPMPVMLKINMPKVKPNSDTPQFI